MRISDEQLIEDARRLARRFTPITFSKEDRDDIIQEVTLALLEARKRFDPKKSSWNNFAYIRARGAIRDFMRSHVIQGRDHKRSGATIYFTSYDGRIHEASVNESYENLKFEEFLETLNKREKLIVICLMRGYSLAEIGRMTGTSYTGLNRLLQRLRIESIPFFSLHHKD